MSVEAIVALIESGSAEEARRLVADAEAEVRARIAEAEAAATRQVDEACARAEPAIRGEALRRVNAVRLRLRDGRASLAVTRTDAVFAAATEVLGRIASGSDPSGGERWAASLRTLAEDCLATCGQGATLAVRARDAARLEALAAAGGARLEPLADEALAGVLARSADGRVEVDARLPARLSRATSRLGGQVAHQLGLEGAQT